MFFDDKQSIRLVCGTVQRGTVAISVSWCVLDAEETTVSMVNNTRLVDA